MVVVVRWLLDGGFDHPFKAQIQTPNNCSTLVPYATGPSMW